MRFNYNLSLELMGPSFPRGQGGSLRIQPTWGTAGLRGGKRVRWTDDRGQSSSSPWPFLMWAERNIPLSFASPSSMLNWVSLIYNIIITGKFNCNYWLPSPDLRESGSSCNCAAITTEMQRKKLRCWSSHRTDLSPILCRIPQCSLLDPSKEP